ncbi:hypothetical protein [Arthrobacter pigmenti]
MNNSEHDPANPHSDNEGTSRASHDSTAGNDSGFHDSTADDGSFHDSGGDARNDASGTGEDHPSTDDSDAPPSDDEVWQDLVARLQNTESLPDDLEDTQPSLRPGEFPGPPGAGESRPGESTPPGKPAESPRDESRAPRTPGAQRPDSQGTAAPRRYGQDNLGGPRDYTPEDEDDDGYVPEDPPSLAGAEPLVVLAWIGAVGGPLALLLSAFIFRSIPMLAIVGIVAVFVASVVFLLWRLPSERGDDHDDGAIV